jgi:hypothetical protein
MYACCNGLMQLVGCKDVYYLAFTCNVVHWVPPRRSGAYAQNAYRTERGGSCFHSLASSRRPRRSKATWSRRVTSLFAFYT